MLGSVDWRDAKYEEVLEQETLGLHRRRAAEPQLTPTKLEDQLKHLYIMEGADWGGRGELQDVVLAATIAAYEAFIAEWKKTLKIHS